MDRLPSAFVDRMVEVLGSRERLDELLEVSPRRAVRVNRLKIAPKELVRRLEALGLTVEPIAWAEEAFFVDDPQADERSLGNVFEHQAGQMFLQAPVSTLPVQALDPQPGDRVLDIAAAPGSKTTHIVERTRGRGLVVANDLHPGRINNMISNLDQTGATNTVVSQADGCRLVWPMTFDKVLVDAPCTTLGSIHASWEPVQRYSEERVAQLVGKQKALLTSAFHAVEVGGTIVYSTCTLEPRENEGVASWFLEGYPVELKAFEPGIGHPGEPEVGSESYDPAVEGALRVHADEAASESFFVARFNKLETAPFEEGREGHWGSAEVQPGPEGSIEELVDRYELEHDLLDEMAAFRTPSRWYGFTGPDPDAAMQLHPERAGLYMAKPEPKGPRLSFEAATLLGQGAGRTIELGPEDARAWLAGDEIDLGLGHDVPDAWAIVTCHGEVIGCARPFGTKLPCYVPKRNRVPAEAGLVGFLAAEGV